MDQTSKIKLNTSCIINVPLQTYEEFTFIVNNKEFKTSRLISDLLSPKICKIHSIDPTIDTYSINTRNKGDFSHILDLVNFNQQAIPNEEISFIIEIIENLGNSSVELLNATQTINLTIDNVFDLIKDHEISSTTFYSKQFEAEVDFISSNLFEILSSNEDELMSLQKSTIIQIFSNPKFRIKTEDQLISFINKLYISDHSYSFMYEFVIFSCVSEEKMKEFIQIFDYNDLTNETWYSISKRLEKKVNIEQENNENRYEHNNNNNKINLPYTENLGFKGIINYLLAQNEGDINDHIKITSTKLESKEKSTKHVINYKEKRDYFSSGPFDNPWICFDFIDRKIVLTHYTIRGYYHTNQPKSWVIEGQNDNNEDKWEIIDEQKENDKLKGGGKTYTFSTKNPNNKPYRYIRMRSTSNDWDNDRYLCINAIEFYGTLI